MEINIGKLRALKKRKENNIPKSTVYGPVSSWRLGRSLGIDMLCSDQKSCNFDCIYCQLGSEIPLKTERKEFVSINRLTDDLKNVENIAIDWVTFSGMGEPTLAVNLGTAIKTVKSILDLPVAVLTNGSFVSHEDVRRDLALADLVVAKLDAPDESLFKSINRPDEEIEFAKILQGWQQFRMEYKGKLAVSMMLTDLNKKQIYHLQYMARALLPDQVQINTPLRSCGIEPLPATEIQSLAKTWFWNFKDVINVYEGEKMEVIPLNTKETELRHPTKICDSSSSTESVVIDNKK
jgi:wyosine [tRNA(Phe)-imidazoG37] synthetase (radical SAM superfamily)